MLQHLDEQDLNLYGNIDYCRKLGRDLNTEELFAKKLLAFDWYYGYSDDNTVWRRGKRAEEDLSAEIAGADIRNSVKEKFLKIFGMDHDQRKAVLDEYRWLDAMDWVDKNPTTGRLGLAFKGVTDEEFSEYQQLATLFEPIAHAVMAGNCAGRLIMTDDTPPYSVLREKAMRDGKVYDDFYLGVAVHPVVQAQLDSIVREHKDNLVRLVQHGAHPVLFSGFNVDESQAEGLWMITVRALKTHGCEFGFYMHTSPTRARAEWSNRPKPEQSRLMPKEEVLERVARALPKSYGEAAPVAPSIPTLPAKKTPMALSNRPMTMDDKPTVKPVKAAPKARTKHKQFVSLHELKG